MKSNKIHMMMMKMKMNMMMMRLFTRKLHTTTISTV
jgi:hypothetical protein